MRTYHYLDIKWLSREEANAEYEERSELLAICDFYIYWSKVTLGCLDIML